MNPENWLYEEALLEEIRALPLTPDERAYLSVLVASGAYQRITNEGMAA